MLDELKTVMIFNFLPIILAKMLVSLGWKHSVYDGMLQLFLVAELVGMTFLDSNVSICMKSLKKHDVLWTAIPPLRIYHNKTILNIKRSFHSKKFIGSSLIIVRNWKQTKCPITRKKLNKPWYIHSLEYYVPLKIFKNIM